MSFVHLHLHSQYSLLSGMCRIEDVVARAKELGMPAVAVTDNGALYGAFKFWLEAKSAGIKPIIGIDAYKAEKSRLDKQPGPYRDQDRLVLLIKDFEGYKNLIKIVTASHLEGFHYKPRIDMELIEKYHKGLILLTGSVNGEIPQLILKNQHTQADKLITQYAQIFGRDFYLELQKHPQLEEQETVNTELVKLSRKHGIALVATNDVHYMTAEEAYAHEILLCIQTQRAIFEKDRPLSMIDVPDYYFKDSAYMRGEFIEYPEAIENTLKIAEECNLEIPYGKWVLPHFDTPKGKSPDEYLEVLLNERIGRLKGYDKDVVKKRIDYELKILKDKGYSTYFLIVQDFVNWAKGREIAVGPGRGSVAGSLISYVLGITDINPLDYDLFFERFLTSERPTPPDMDIDFADIRRDEVLQYVRHKYGENKVAQIITFGTMEARMVIRDVSRALGMSYSQGDRIAKMIPPPKQGFSVNIARALEESSQLKFEYQTEKDTKNMIDIAQKLEGLPRHASVHAAGVIITDKDLTEYVPLQREPKEGKIITQYDMYSLDLNAVSDNKAIGLLKMDFLGLRNLTILENALDLVKETIGRRIDIHDVPIDDAKTYELISAGHTVGVFQLESGGMRRLAKDLKPTRMTDIIAMVALYRPGPMELIPLFLESKKNPEKIKYPHKDIRPILEETYGVLVYQEQVMEIANKMAGYTMSEADGFRLAMGKKKKALMKLEQIKFVDGFIKNNYSKKLAERIFGFIEKFAAYGFNKPHSASYGLIAYWTAYLKANYPIEFMTALLTAELKGVAGSLREVKMAQTLEECRRMEIQVLPPDINASHESFTIEKKGIRFGLSAIKNVGGAAIESVLEARKPGPFTGFRDFLTRVDLRRVNKKTVESLIKAGAFLEFYNRATLLATYPQIVREIGDKKDDHHKGQFGLFGENDKSGKAPSDNFDKLEELSEDEVLMMEKEVIGFHISQNPLSRFKQLIDERTNKKIGDITPEDKDKTFILAGILSGKKIVKTKRDNSEMAFITLFDETGSIEAVVFPKVYEKINPDLSINQPLLFKGKVTDREDGLSIIIDNAKKLS